MIFLHFQVDRDVDEIVAKRLLQRAFRKQNRKRTAVSPQGKVRRKERKVPDGSAEEGLRMRRNFCGSNPFAAVHPDDLDERELVLRPSDPFREHPPKCRLKRKKKITL